MHGKYNSAKYMYTADYVFLTSPKINANADADSHTKLLLQAERPRFAGIIQFVHTALSASY